ncbi:aa3-type cytochrome c oxidase subunit IV [Sneathiella chungangensis]|uniref:Aa3-type cytochrome c oxidase subunit IV n=1 Tax=Sneathiella chungangensis TaxID=1418234 RepID=A0A845MED5_9PROT|nr:aa3-type cytochrome c oxidase subunit IV [Sneathiella chungangensis]MZR22229.1 aa3-type cytochrome c oxidase subunit IV [Sneathiella chungangensis]
MHENGSMDISAQKESFHAFVKLFKYCTIFLVILLILMGIFLT